MAASPSTAYSRLKTRTRDARRQMSKIYEEGEDGEIKVSIC